MKRSVILFIFLFYAQWFIYCKKEYSCENCIPSGNHLPIANAGSDQTIMLPKDSVVLDGTNSTDPDGNITNYVWTKITGPPSSIDNLNAGKTTMKALKQGIYQMELKVTDNNGGSARDTLLVVVTSSSLINQPPVAQAGTDQTILLPADSTVLDGTGSFDPDGTIVSYSWTKLDGPGQVIIKYVTEAKTSVTGLEEGVYHFRLSVTDNNGNIDDDTIQINCIKNSSDYPGFTFNKFWSCNDICDDNDVYVTILPGLSPFGDPNVPLEVFVLDSSSTWIAVYRYTIPLPPSAKYYYFIRESTLFVHVVPYPGASQLLGKSVTIRVRFL